MRVPRLSVVGVAEDCCQRKPSRPVSDNEADAVAQSAGPQWNNRGEMPKPSKPQQGRHTRELEAENEEVCC